MARNGAPRARALVLFDIDGTLIRRAGPAHREVLEEAVFRTTGLRASTDSIPVQGMLDGEILRQMLRRAGAKAADARAALPEIMQRAQTLYARRCPDLHRKVCPGVRGVLGRLRRWEVPTGLVTGNLSRIGWKKMERAGLREHFRFGAFAEAARTRAGLARLAVAHARREGWIERGSPVTLIGDHPNDILAARANRIRVVAVGTGVVSMDELAAHQPDMLVEDLRALDPRYLISQ